MFSVYDPRNEIRQSRNEFSFGFAESRYDRLNKKAAELDVGLLEAEVLWGHALHASKQSMKQCLSTLWKANRRQIAAQREGAQLTDKEKEEVDAVLYGYGVENDQFGNSVEMAVSGFENALRPYLKRSN
jgi:hypothetical protein